MTAIAHINRIGTALPPHDVHDAFVRFVSGQLDGHKIRPLFERMVSRAGIEHRFSYVEPVAMPDGTIADTGGFYGGGVWPTTAQRMRRYELWAPRLAMAALDALDIADERDRITHLIVASCTGFVAPGLDQLIVAQAGLDPGVERTVVGFMGCYAAVNALRLAHHIVRSTPAARVLVMNLELCSLHFQQTDDLESLLSMLLFGDGCAAALVTADAHGIALRDFRATTLIDSADAITWRIGDQGFDMVLSGEVPLRIGHAMQEEVRTMAEHGLLRGVAPAEHRLWAVHAGGRSILDAVERGLGLPADALDVSRAVLRDCGNMSSATLMFVLARMLADPALRGEAPSPGFGVAFGPGLAAESFRFDLLGT